MGLFDGNTGQGGFHPMDMLRGRMDSIRAHPFQNIMSGLMGAVVPGGGMAAQAGFDRYNNGQFNQAAQTGYDRSLQETTMDANSAMNAPLNGQLGDYDRQNPYGDAGSPQPGGGMNGGMNNGNTQNWQYGQFNQTNPQPPAQSPFVQQILNSIGPNGPGMSGNGGGGGNGGMGPGGGGMQGGPSYGSPLTGGGFQGVMNGASGNMLSDFAAPMGGDYMNMIRARGVGQGASATTHGASMR